MKLALKIAWRFLSSSKGQTILITVGIAIGIAVQVFIGSLITGLQKSLVDKTIGSSSQVTVLSKESNGLISDYASIMDKIKTSEKEVVQISAAADASGFIKFNDNTYPILMRGFDLAAADGIYKLKAALIKGELPADNEIIVGRTLAEEAGLAVGDKVDVLTPQGKPTALTISGIYDLKVSGINKSWVISNLGLVQSIFGYGDKVTSIETQVKQVFDADIVAGSLGVLLTPDLKVENWKAQNESLLSGLSGQSISSLMIQVFVLVSVVLGIASVLAVSVLQKSRQLGILKAMGIKNRTASLIFLFQGLILGFFGAALGVLLGLGLAVSFTKFAVSADGTPVVALFIDPNFILLSGLIGMISAAVASLIPAGRSAKLDPMEVIKNG
jgi:lipoprotein-releasing system permease protein